MVNSTEDLLRELEEWREKHRRARRMLILTEHKLRLFMTCTAVVVAVNAALTCYIAWKGLHG